MVLDFLEFIKVFPGPGNSLNLAVFIQMSLNTLESLDPLKRSNVLQNCYKVATNDYDRITPANCSLRIN